LLTIVIAELADEDIKRNPDREPSIWDLITKNASTRKWGNYNSSQLNEKMKSWKSTIKDYLFKPAHFKQKRQQADFKQRVQVNTIHS
jgi:hypothetical protein